MKLKLALLLVAGLIFAPLVELTALTGGVRGSRRGARGFGGGGRSLGSGGRNFSSGGFRAGASGVRSSGPRASGYSRPLTYRGSPYRPGGAVRTGGISRPGQGQRRVSRPGQRPGQGVGQRPGTGRPANGKFGQGMSKFRGQPGRGIRNPNRGVNGNFWNRGFHGRGWNWWYSNYFPFFMGVFPFLYFADNGVYPDVYYDYFDQYGAYPEPIDNYDQYVSGEMPWPFEGQGPGELPEGLPPEGLPLEGEPPFEESAGYSEQPDVYPEEGGPTMIFVS